MIRTQRLAEFFVQGNLVTVIQIASEVALKHEYILKEKYTLAAQIGDGSIPQGVE